MFIYAVNGCASNALCYKSRGRPFGTASYTENP
jgi:hypothetical protein